MLKLTFFGGAGGVTGSKHLIENGTEKVLLDCGTFQGLPDIRERNRSFPFPPDEITAVILSHAHLDHCGMLPLLVKRGFRGSIYATAATRDVAHCMLLDAASIEVQDAEYRATHHIGSPDDRVPLFTPEDIPATIDRFVTVPYARERDEWQTVTPTIKLKFYDAGHILGSAIAVLDITTATGSRSLAYTGDIGLPATPLLADPEVPHEPIETMLIESTYGARTHDSQDKALERLASTINRVIERQGKIIIPAFALGRTQLFVYLLHKLTDEGHIPRLPMYVDSPLATRITQIFKQYGTLFDSTTGTDFPGAEHRPLMFRNLDYVESINESKALNSKPGPFIIVAASGMMTSGRVVHHLRHSINDPRNAVLITGYQAHG
ncbi:MAG: MBL fold metallo-hydrolase, partial [Candidatus Andersenbacteria bacterium]